MADSTVSPSRTRAFGTCDVHVIRPVDVVQPQGCNGPDAIVVKRFDDSSVGGLRSEAEPANASKTEPVSSSDVPCSSGERRTRAPPPDFDELPINTGLNSGKLASFEELLERELAKEKTKAGAEVVPHSEQQMSPDLADNNSLSTASPASACFSISDDGGSTVSPDSGADGGSSSPSPDAKNAQPKSRARAQSSESTSTPRAFLKRGSRGWWSRSKPKKVQTQTKTQTQTNRPQQPRQQSQKRTSETVTVMATASDMSNLTAGRKPLAREGAPQMSHSDVYDASMGVCTAADHIADHMPNEQGEQEETHQQVSQQEQRQQQQKHTTKHHRPKHSSTGAIQEPVHTAPHGSLSSLPQENVSKAKADELAEFEMLEQQAHDEMAHVDIGVDQSEPININVMPAPSTCSTTHSSLPQQHQLKPTQWESTTDAAADAASGTGDKSANAVLRGNTWATYSGGRLITSRPTHPPSPPAPPAHPYVAGERHAAHVENARQDVNENEIEKDRRQIDVRAPPTSSLVQSVFTAHSTSMQHECQSSQSSLRTRNERVCESEADPGPGPGPDLSDDLRDAVEQKVVALEAEIMRYKSMNKRVRKMREELERQREQLSAERAQMDDWKQSERSEMESWLAGEKRKLQRDQRAVARQRAAASRPQPPNRAERAEITGLKAEVAKLKLEASQRMSKDRSELRRLRRQNDEATRRITQLQEEVRCCEQQRLDTWAEQEQSQRAEGTQGGLTQTTAQTQRRVSSMQLQGQQHLRMRQRDAIDAGAHAVHAGDTDTTVMAKVDGPPSLENITHRHGETSPVHDSDYDPARYGVGQQIAPLDSTNDGEKSSDYTEHGEYDETNKGMYYDEHDSEIDEHEEYESDEEHEDTEKHGVHSGQNQSDRQHEGELASKCDSRRTCVDEHKYGMTQAKPKGQIVHVDAKRTTGAAETVAVRPKESSTSSPTATAVAGPTVTAVSATVAAVTTTTTMEDKADMVGEVRHADGKIERRYSNGTRQIVFRNNTRKEVYPDGSSKVYFANGDSKKTLGDGTVEYYYASAQTSHTTYANGIELFEFPNEQTEKHWPHSKRKEIRFRDGTVKLIDDDGNETTTYSDGTQEVRRIDGTHSLHVVSNA